MVSSYNIVVLGPEKVGKSALVKQFLKKDFVSSYKPTVEENYNYLAKMSDGGFKSVDILDTAGSNDFPVMRKLRIQRADAFIIVYAVDDVQSFADVKTYYEQINEEKGTTELPIIVVGNKMDIASRQVSTEEATTLTRDDLKCFHLETSAKFNLNVENMFCTLFLKTMTFSTLDSKSKYNGKRKTKRSISTIVSLKSIHQGNMVTLNESKHRRHSVSAIVCDN